MAIAGRGGGVYVGVNKVAEVRSWSLSIEGDTLETSTFDSGGWKTSLSGQRGWSGTFDADWKMTDTTGQKAFQDSVMGGTTMSVKLDVDGTHNYTGTAFIVSENVETPADDIVTVSFDYQGTGALVYT